MTGGLISGLGGCQQPGGNDMRESVPEDGGLAPGSTDARNSKAPKEIKSEDLNYFAVECNFTGLADEHDYDFVYGYAAPVKDGVMVGLKYTASFSYQGDERNYSKVAFVKGDVLQELQAIVKVNNFAKNNGLYHYVNGLPQNFGGYVRVGYSSGESISFEDNQGAVIGADTGKDIVDVLKKYIENNRAENIVASNIDVITYRQERGEKNYTAQRLERNKLTCEQRFGTDSKVFHNEYSVTEADFDKVAQMVMDSGMLYWDGLPEDSSDLYKISLDSLTVTINDGTECVAKQNMKAPANAPSDIFKICMVMEDLKIDENKIAE